jgi:HAD superfamily hydrolase (TIGR01509 family)
MTLLIFDCDGVLVDSEVLAHETLVEMLTALGVPMTLEEALGTFAGGSLKDTMALIEQRLGCPVPNDVGEFYRGRLLARLRAVLKPVAGAEEAIAALPYSRCAASSSSPDRLYLALEVTGLAAIFGPHVFSATQVEHGKPAPDLFLFAARRMGAEPAHCIVIEDSARGVEAGRAAGMKVIGFAGASHTTGALARRLSDAGAHRVIHAMRELPACVEELRARDRTSQ